jgi:hypothetical protein
MAAHSTLAQRHEDHHDGGSDVVFVMGAHVSTDGELGEGHGELDTRDGS